MKTKFIHVRPISSRAKSIFKNSMNSDGKCKVTMEAESMYFVKSSHKDKCLVVYKKNDLNWSIVPE